MGGQGQPGGLVTAGPFAMSLKTPGAQQVRRSLPTPCPSRLVRAQGQIVAVWMVLACWESAWPWGLGQDWLSPVPAAAVAEARPSSQVCVEGTQDVRT